MNVGLKRYEYVASDGDTRTGPVSDLPDFDYTILTGFYKAGNYALGLGIPGIFFAAGATGLGLVAITGSGKYRVPVTGLTIGGGAFLLAAVFLWGKTIFVGWAMSLYTVSPFMLLCGLILLVLGLVDGGENPVPAGAMTGGSDGGGSSSEPRLMLERDTPSSSTSPIGSSPAVKFEPLVDQSGKNKQNDGTVCLWVSFLTAVRSGFCCLQLGV